MTLSKMIAFGHSNPKESADFYYWVQKVETYLKTIENRQYLVCATPWIYDCMNHGANSIKRHSAVSHITATLMRIYDNQQETYLNENVASPLLSIFKDARLQPVQTSFESAIQCKNEGRYEHAITDACKAIESMCKVICSELCIPYNDKDTLSKLIQKLRVAQVLPFDGMLDGCQVMRNKTAAHGQASGAYTADINDANFEINRTAAVLLYLYNRSSMNSSMCPHNI